MLGIQNRYTVGLRDLAVFAAIDGSFDKVQKRLLKFCGMSPRLPILPLADNRLEAFNDRRSWPRPAKEHWMRRYCRGFPFGQMKRSAIHGLIPPVGGLHWRNFVSFNQQYKYHLLNA